MYLVRDKATKKIIFENPGPMPDGLRGKEVYPEFDTKKMELLTYDGEELPRHYDVNPKGVIVEKTFEKKLAENLIEFGTDLFLHTGFDEKSSDLPSTQLVKIGLKYNLIKTIPHCKLAFKLLDDEFEDRVNKKFRPGYEIKIVKNYADWVGEGKPANDKREKKYLDMKDTIDRIKDEYKETRAKLKEIIVPLKKQVSK